MWMTDTLDGFVGLFHENKVLLQISCERSLSDEIG